MDPTFYIRAAAIILLWGIILWIAWSAWRNSRSKRQQPHVSEESDNAAGKRRAQAIINRGGPQDLEEYLELFPQACRRCGGRSFYEKLSVENISSQIPLGASSLLPKRLWACTRCGFGNAPNLEKDPETRLHTVTSPYLDVQIANTITEPLYEDMGEGVNITEFIPNKPELKVEGAQGIELEKIPPTTKASVHLVNDDDTPMDFVIFILSSIFDLPFDKATTIMLQAHHEGESLIQEYTFSEAQKRVISAITKSNEEEHPLSFIIRIDLPDSKNNNST